MILIFLLTMVLPDLVLVDKVARSTKIIDIACVMNCHVADKHGDKIEKYLDLVIELQSLWNTRVEIVPMVFGVLGSLHEKTVLNFELLQLIESNMHLSITEDSIAKD